MTKSQIRTEMKQLRSSLNPAEQFEMSKAIQEKLYQTQQYNDCSYLFTFISFGDEVDTINIIEKGFQDKKRIFVPRIDQRKMDFYEIKSMSNLIQSKFGMLEPPFEEETRYQGTEGFESKLMILPGLAFDSCGNRIGYGAGYYDHFLTEHAKEHFVNIALAYDFQLLEEIPAQAHDQKADYIITPKQLLRCRT